MIVKINFDALNESKENHDINIGKPERTKKMEFLAQSLTQIMDSYFEQNEATLVLIQCIHEFLYMAMKKFSLNEEYAEFFKKPIEKFYEKYQENEVVNKSIGNLGYFLSKLDRENVIYLDLNQKDGVDYENLIKKIVKIFEIHNNLEACEGIDMIIAYLKCCFQKKKKGNNNADYSVSYINLKSDRSHFSTIKEVEENLEIENSEKNSKLDNEDSKVENQIHSELTPKIQKECNLSEERVHSICINPFKISKEKSSNISDFSVSPFSKCVKKIPDIIEKRKVANYTMIYLSQFRTFLKFSVNENTYHLNYPINNPHNPFSTRLIQYNSEMARGIEDELIYQKQSKLAYSSAVLNYMNISVLNCLRFSKEQQEISIRDLANSLSLALTIAKREWIMTKGASQLILDPVKFKSTIGNLEGKRMDCEIGKMVISDLKRFKSIFNVEDQFPDIRELIENTVRRVLIPIELSDGTDQMILRAKRERAKSRDSYISRRTSIVRSSSRIGDNLKFFKKRSICKKLPFLEKSEEESQNEYDMRVSIFLGEMRKRQLISILGMIEYKNSDFIQTAQFLQGLIESKIDLDNRRSISSVCYSRLG